MQRLRWEVCNAGSSRPECVSKHKYMFSVMSPLVTTPWPQCCGFLQNPSPAADCGLSEWQRYCWCILPQWSPQCIWQDPICIDNSCAWYIVQWKLTLLCKLGISVVNLPWPISVIITALISSVFWTWYLKLSECSIEFLAPFSKEWKPGMVLDQRWRGL